VNFRLRIGAGIVLSLLLLVLVLVLPSDLAMAQSTSSVRGTIADQQGGVLPNATVTLTSKDTNLLRTQKTSPAGNFSFDLIPPGHYMLTIESQGFKKTEEPVEALVARPSDLGTIKLQVGAAGETITVTAENQAVQVNTQDSSLGANFVSQQITQLPIEARNVLSLLTLQAAVTKDGYVAGARSDQSNITLDGVNINDAQTNSINSPVLRLNAESVEEFRVNTLTSNASAGRSAGAQISLITKSGTNQFRGSLFEYHRNTIFTANDWFSNHATPQVPRRALIRNVFGGALGGPIKKDKLFFFYSYEARRDGSSKPVSPRDVPLPNLAAGIIRFNDSNGVLRQLNAADLKAIFPDTGGVNPASLVALAKGASYGANSTAVGDGLNTSGFIFNSPAPVQLNSHVARLDYNISSNQTFYLRTNVIYDHDQDFDSKYFPDTKAPQLWSHPWGFAAAHTWTIHNNLISNFRYGFTRQAFTSGGDTDANYTFLRLVFYQTNGTRTAARTTPVHNFVEDLSWVKGNHTFAFGGNMILVANASARLGQAYDTAYTNPSGYKTNLIINSVNQYLTEKYGYQVDGGSQSSVENAVTALLGRYNQYTANFQFDHSGKLLPAGTPVKRNFATQGYEAYFQDSWKMKPNLTLTAGLRYSLWRPVYERNGYETQPDITLSEFFNRRVAGMLSGNPYNDLLTISPTGPANNGPPMYSWDKKVFLPKVAVAWQPRFNNGFLSALFGKNGQSVLRGGFAIANDYFGQQIATFFDQRNTLGYVQSQLINVNTFNVGCGHYVMVGNGLSSCTAKLGPLFTAFGDNVRTLPLITAPSSVTFPTTATAVHYPTSIQSSLDAGLVTPKNYQWSVTYEREMPKSGLLQVSYLGRLSRHLLAQRDVMTPVNLVDPKSGMSWYTAATILEKARQAGTDPSYFATHPIPYFENLFSPLIADWGYPNATQAVYDDAYSYNANDWTTTMLDIDGESTVGSKVNGYSHAFYQPQYGALTSWSTIANSTYHALTVSYRERLKGLTLDFNYTYSHSLDDASGLQTGDAYSGSSLILNPFQQRDNYTSSDFDMRHMINVSSVWALPVGRGKYFLGDLHGAAEAILGSWQLSNIFRWNTGIPFGAPYDANTWATNWEVQSYTTVVNPLSPNGCPDRNVATPKFFGNCLQSAFSSFRNAYPGDTGSRNYFRFPSYINMDFGLGKTWKMPYKEGHELQFRWEVFNVTNTQRFGENLDWSRAGWGIAPGSTTPAPEFSNFTQIQGSPRVMQFGLRYSF
jgi:Carboxypeptidase regulatory-like domain